MVQPKINLIVLGDAAVGKTSLLRRVDKRDFQPNHLKTIAVEFIKTEYVNEEDEKRVEVRIWDTAGQEKFRNITYQFYRQADGIIVAFDKTSDKTFKAVSNWIQSIYKVKDTDTPVVIVGNKLDLEDKIVVTPEAAQDLASQHSMNYHETSAKTGQGVEVMINDVLSQVYRHKIRPTILGSAAGAGVGAAAAGSGTSQARLGGNLQDPSQQSRMMHDRASFPLTTKQQTLKGSTVDPNQESQYAGCCQ